MNFPRISKWAIATRVETTSLAVASVGLGSALAAWHGLFHWRIGFLSVLTAVFLQIICNLANDYGDFVRGADPINKAKPPSALQTNLVTLKEVKRAIQWLLIPTIGVGGALLYCSGIASVTLLFFILLGGLCVVAAITYTLGDQPYGYQGWGDVAVFTFFGLVGVGGTFYLHTQQLSTVWLLPATSCGLLAVAVLNVNNIRDIVADAKVGKKTIPVRIGKNAALGYHWCLLVGSLVAVVVFLALYTHTPCSYGCICMAPLLLRHGIAVGRTEATQLSAQLQQLVFIIIGFIGLLSAGLVVC